MDLDLFKIKLQNFYSVEIGKSIKEIDIFLTLEYQLAEEMSLFVKYCNTEKNKDLVNNLLKDVFSIYIKNQKNILASIKYIDRFSGVYTSFTSGDKDKFLVGKNVMFGDHTLSTLLWGLNLKIVKKLLKDEQDINKELQKMISDDYCFSYFYFQANYYYLFENKYNPIKDDSIEDSITDNCPISIRFDFEKAMKRMSKKSIIKLIKEFRSYEDEDDIDDINEAHEISDNARNLLNFLINMEDRQTVTLDDSCFFKFLKEPKERYSGYFSPTYDSSIGHSQEYPHYNL